MKGIIKEHIIIFSMVLLTIVILTIIGVSYFVRILNLASWEAISAVGEWASTCVAVFIPISAIYLEKQLEEKKEAIRDSNLSLYDEITNLKKEIQGLKKDNQIKIEDNNKELKNEIYKFICISMVTTTQDIIKKFNLELSIAKEKLMELWRVDELITPTYIDSDPESEECNWSKKR